MPSERVVLWIMNGTFRKNEHLQACFCLRSPTEKGSPVQRAWPWLESAGLGPVATAASARSVACHKSFEVDRRSLQPLHEMASRWLEVTGLSPSDARSKVGAL